MKFKSLNIEHWRQFRQVSIQIHEQITIVTGANGAGKTTLLNLLGRHFGWHVQFISTGRLTRKGAYKYYSGIYDDLDEPTGRMHTIGVVEYSDDRKSEIQVPASDQPTFDAHMPGMVQVDGVFLPSHRPVYSFQRVDSIPTEIDANEQLFERYYSNLQALYQPRSKVDSPSFQLKSSLISLATFGYGNVAVRRNLRAIDTFEGFQEVLRTVLPPKLGFQSIEIRIPDVVFKCRFGDFSLDASSGGVAAIVDMAWQLFMKSLLANEFVALIDEPENHLHPELQRTLIPGFVTAFPNAQFVIASHNPFVVTSMRDSNVYVLDYVEGRVESTELNSVDRSASANQILTEVLGVPVPIPVWVENEINLVVHEFESHPITSVTLQLLRERLASVGIGHLFPETIEKLSSAPERV